MSETLEALIAGKADLVEYLRNQQVGPNVYPGVPAEYSNWRAEQWAWGIQRCSVTSRTTWSIWR